MATFNEKGNNPLVINNDRIKALDKAYQLFIKTLDEYVKDNPLSKQEIKEIKILIQNAYKRKKLSHFLNHKTSSLKKYLDEAIFHSLQQDIDKKDSDGNLYYNYPKRTNYLIANE